MKNRFPITEDGEKVDLTGKTPYLQVKGTNVNNRQCTVDPQDSSVVLYTVQKGDFDNSDPGDYRAEIELQGSGYKEDTKTFAVTLVPAEV